MQVITSNARIADQIASGSPVLRASVMAWRDGAQLSISDGSDIRRVTAAWQIDFHELDSTGQYLLARGDHGRRSAVWEVKTGTQLLDLVGDEVRRESIRASVARVSDRPCVFVASKARKGALVVRSLAPPGDESWLSTSGLIDFEVERVSSLGGPVVAVRGHADGEQYDTVLALDLAAGDVEVLQTALRSKVSVKAWGYRVAIGPAGFSQVVTYRDAEWDEDDRPDDPDEAFRGIELWDLTMASVVDRIPCNLPVESGADIGADSHLVAVATPEYVYVLSRADASSRRIKCFALDPYALAVSRRDGDRIVVTYLNDLADE